MKENFGLYLILTDPLAGYETTAKAAVACGLRYLQLRMKNAPRNEVVEMAIALRKITRGSNTRFIVNDDLAVAIEADADGIHLGQDDLPIEEARKQWNQPGKIFGLSTHSMEQARLAETAGPDYIGIGPVFPTQTKADTAPALGIAEVGRIALATPLTSVAIGGINAANLPGLLQAGADNFCVVGAVNQAPDPAAAIRQLQRLGKYRSF
jgi:thiamine-phosphate pyrophosphorylase